MDHGRPGGLIRVAARGLDDQVSLSVSNEDDPIPAEHLYSIFDPLKRLNRPGHARRAGAGLGLGQFIARQIALAHSGSIAVDSADVTTFTVTLPSVAAQPLATSFGPAAGDV
ncbi:ATP-binding protein [Caballeronia pedi]|uniref:sensor histidine kinase n=1 Tax=Caballeronia pedi TaxID=1777141 RepID=UPI000B360EA7